MSSRFFLKLLLAASAVALVTWNGAGAQQAPAQCIPDGTTGRLKPDIRKTVVITDPKVFEQADFSFARTLGAILTTGTTVDGYGADAKRKAPAPDTSAGREALLATLIQTFEEADPENLQSRVKMPLTRRPGELALRPKDLLDPTDPVNGMRPIGLFNRLDLAPINKRYCGEHRIVYGKGDLSNRLDRFFLIFEAAVDNPDVDDRVAGCRRIADFWNGLATKDGQELAGSLEKFYYEGDLGDGGPKMTPVVHTQHYGVPFGQIRGNLFVTQENPIDNPWMLREWRISISPETGKPVFIPDTVKSNPDPRLYAKAGAVPTEESVGFAGLRPEFHQNVVLNHVREVIELDLKAVKEGKDKADATDLFAGISARLEDQFNSFQSISQSPDDDPFTRAKGTDLIDRIADELGNYKLPPDSDLTAEHILNRIGALSCAGCHHQSVGKEIAKGVNWPAVAETSVPPAPAPPNIGFVHINEKGELSEALEKHFLPERCKNMQDNILKPAPAEMTVAQSEALSPREARSGFNRIQESLSSIDKRAEIFNFSTKVEDVRQADFQTPGAFYAFRRTH